MKSLLHPTQTLRLFAHPFHRAAIPFFFVLAFMPCILRLTSLHVPVTNPLVALGTAAAGFWLAFSLREIRLRFALLGPALAALLWLSNWLILAGSDCCSF